MVSSIPKRERTWRVILGLIFLLLAGNINNPSIGMHIESSVLQALLYILGFYALITGSIGRCPLRSLLRR